MKKPKCSRELALLIGILMIVKTHTYLDGKLARGHLERCCSKAERQEAVQDVAVKVEGN